MSYGLRGAMHHMATTTIGVGCGRMKFIVIGAGLSGLAAAYRFQQAGHEVEIVEAADRPGGRCATVA